MSLVISVVCIGCLEPYAPPDISGVGTMLVVDGFINSGDESAVVKLSRSIPLDSTGVPAPETNASVIIEKEDATKFALTETSSGIYQLDHTVFDNSAKYRVHINTADNAEYISDFVELTTAPEIDSVTWKANETGIELFVNTHESSGAARYYKWDYVETWEYHASFFSAYKFLDGEAFRRSVEERIFQCYSNTTSTEINIGNSTRLSDDVIRDFPVVYIPGSSAKLNIKYSALIKQRTLTKEAYDFWEQLQKTTETLGNLFDPQPYQVLGNIHSVSGDRNVLGYFEGGNVTEKRIFIIPVDLPRHIKAMRQGPICGEETVRAIPIADLPITPNGTMLIDAIYVSGIGLIGYTATYPICVDCRLQGGGLVKPDFW